MTINEKRCADCTELKNGKCMECFGQSIEEIDDCPFGVTVESIAETEKKAKENKISKGAKAETTKERKPREKKVDDEKKEIIEILAKALTDNGYNAIITNVDKEIDIDGMTVNLVKHRAKKGDK